MTFSHFKFRQRMSYAVRRYDNTYVLFTEEPGTTKTCVFCGRWIKNVKRATNGSTVLSMFSLFHSLAVYFVLLTYDPSLLQSWQDVASTGRSCSQQRQSPSHRGHGPELGRRWRLTARDAGGHAYLL